MEDLGDLLYYHQNRKDICRETKKLLYHDPPHGKLLSRTCSVGCQSFRRLRTKTALEVLAWTPFTPSKTQGAVCSIIRNVSSLESKASNLLCYRTATFNIQSFAWFSRGIE